MILGQYKSKISNQRRTAIPSKFRAFLGKKFIVAQWYESCLVLVSHSKWEKLLNRITGTARVVTKPVRVTERFIMGSAFELEPDSQGRVVIPEKLASFAKLGKEVVFLGLGDRIEVWDSKVWEKQEEIAAGQASAYLERIDSNEKQ